MTNEKHGKGNSFSNGEATASGTGPVASSPAQAVAGSNDSQPSSCPQYPA